MWIWLNFQRLAWIFEAYLLAILAYSKAFFKGSSLWKIQLCSNFEAAIVRFQDFDITWKNVHWHRQYVIGSVNFDHLCCNYIHNTFRLMMSDFLKFPPWEGSCSLGVIVSLAYMDIYVGLWGWAFGRWVHITLLVYRGKTAPGWPYGGRNHPKCFSEQ
jgi:hypothetical protein